jgi:hypothetical protein
LKRVASRFSLTVSFVSASDLAGSMAINAEIIYILMILANCMEKE